MKRDGGKTFLNHFWMAHTVILFILYVLRGYYIFHFRVGMM